MRASPPVPGTTSDESTPLVAHRESASATAEKDVWFSRRATLALVGACAIFSYAARASSSGATPSLGSFSGAPGVSGGRPGSGGRGDPRAASEERSTQTLRGAVGELEGRMRALSRDNDALRAEVERLAADNARLSAREVDREEASAELVSSETELGALRAERTAVRARSRALDDATRDGDESDEDASVGDDASGKPSRGGETDARRPAFASAEHLECDETMYGARGAGYRGCQSVTRSGLTCQSWAARTPHQHSHFFARASADGGESAEDAKNHCRNPDGGDSIWCYTTDPNTRFDYCDPRPGRRARVV